MDITKLVSPWTPEEIRGIVRWRRYHIRYRKNKNMRTTLCWVSPNPDGHLSGFSYEGRVVWPNEGITVFGGHRDYSNSLVDLQNLLDKELQNDGYVFLPQEEWDKYQLLM
jgi:hypothetical protein